MKLEEFLVAELLRRDTELLRIVFLRPPVVRDFLHREPPLEALLDVRIVAPSSPLVSLHEERGALVLPKLGKEGANERVVVFPRLPFADRVEALAAGHALRAARRRKPGCPDTRIIRTRDDVDALHARRFEDAFVHLAGDPDAAAAIQDLDELRVYGAPLPRRVHDRRSINRELVLKSGPTGAERRDDCFQKLMAMQNDLPNGDRSPSDRSFSEVIDLRYDRRLDVALELHLRDRKRPERHRKPRVREGARGRARVTGHPVR